MEKKQKTLNILKPDNTLRMLAPRRAEWLAATSETRWKQQERIRIKREKSVIRTLDVQMLSGWLSAPQVSYARLMASRTAKSASKQLKRSLKF